MAESKRIKSLDILKSIGLVCIVIAHINAPSLVAQARNFDVVLLLIVSTRLFLDKNNNQQLRWKQYASYIWKRIKRLLFPTYLFLGIFFLGAIVIKPYPFDIKQILDSFLLRDGIGYVWIVRLYLILAIMLPIVTSSLKKRQVWGARYELLIAGCLIVAQEVLYNLGLFNGSIILNDVVGYILPCVAIIVWTDWIKRASMKKILWMSLACTLIFIITACIYLVRTGEFQPTQIAKYPFRLYYLSYAFAASSGLILLMKNKKIVSRLWNRGVLFLSMHSFWIYLWHIPFVFFINWKFPGLNWLIKFIVVLIGACVITLSQAIVTKKLYKIGVNKELVKILEG